MASTPLRPSGITTAFQAHRPMTLDTSSPVMAPSKTVRQAVTPSPGFSFAQYEPVNMKANELFLTWLSSPSTSELIVSFCEDLKAGRRLDVERQEMVLPSPVSPGTRNQLAAMHIGSSRSPPLSPAKGKAAQRVLRFGDELKTPPASPHLRVGQQQGKAGRSRAGGSGADSDGEAEVDLSLDDDDDIGFVSEMEQDLAAMQIEPGGDGGADDKARIEAKLAGPPGPPPMGHKPRWPRRRMLTIPRFHVAKSARIAAAAKAHARLAEDERQALRRAFSQYMDDDMGRGDAKPGPTLQQFVTICKNLWKIPTFICPLVFRRIIARQKRKLWGSDFPRITLAAALAHFDAELAVFCENGSPDMALRIFNTLCPESPDPSGEERVVGEDGEDVARTLKPEDFQPVLDELLAFHPGLEFLESTAEFQEKYARTVIARIFYVVNRSMNGAITLRELRASDLTPALQLLDEEEDINKVTRYFSYEHFYVLYCKFWELDDNHDFVLTKDNVLRYGNHCLTRKIVDRIFSHAIRPLQVDAAGGPNDRQHMSYEDFIYFFMSEIDKTNAISLRYWYHLVDLGGRGFLTAQEMRFFYGEQAERLDSLGHEVVAFEDVLCQMSDLIRPKVEGMFRIAEFTTRKKVGRVGVFFNTLFSLSEFIAYESRDPFAERQMKQDDPDSTPWDRFAREEYARLAMEEEMRERGMVGEDDWMDQGSHSD